MSTQPHPILMILRLKQVSERTGLSRSTIYSKLDPDSAQYDPGFPTQIRLGGGAVGWIEAELNTWLERCVNTSRPCNAELFMPVARQSNRHGLLASVVGM